MTSKPPKIGQPRVPEGYGKMQHTPTARQHHVPTRVRGPLPQPKDGVGIPGKGAVYLSEAAKGKVQRGQRPPEKYSKPVQAPKGARS